MSPIQMVWALASTYGLTALGGVIWAVRQEGRINAHDQRFLDAGDAVDQRFRQNDVLLLERHVAILKSLERLDAKVDKVLENQ